VAITETLLQEFVIAGVDVCATVLCPSMTSTNIGTSARDRPGDRAEAAESRNFRDQDLRLRLRS
jgi:hypothetical protein